MEDWLAAQFRAHPDGLALVFKGQEWTFTQLDQQVDDWCRRLSKLNPQQGEIVAVRLPNSPIYVCLVHALARMGLVLAPLNNRLARAELDWQLGKLGCRWLIGELPSEGESIWNGRVISLEELATQPPVDYQPQPVDLDRLQAIVFTSGTAGKPKGAMLTFGNHFWSALGSAARLGLHTQDRWLSALPLYHVGGLAVVFRSCLYGTAISLHAGFDLAAIEHSLDREPVTLVSVVPTMLRRLLAARRAFPETLRAVLLGGAAAPSDLLHACQERGLPVAVTYGLTEASSQVATMAPADVLRKPSCVGKPLLFTQVRIKDEDGIELPAGVVGEICVSGPTVMKGYFADEEATRRCLREGELHTGDLGYLDADGDLWVVQRRSDLILSGGENVYPVEVEAVLHQHPAVAEACVVGLPDAEWGQRVAAAVVLKEKERLSEEELTAFLRQRLAGYKQPRLVRFVKMLPQTASGKVARSEVAALLVGAEDEDAEP